MATHKKKHTQRNVAIGAGLALAAASVAAAYFLSGKEGAKRRKEIKGWMVKAKGEVLQRMEQAKDMNEKMYATIVDQVSSQYRGAKQIDAKDIQAFAKEMKGYWRDIKKSVSKERPKAARRSK
jgi:hypothetical protein